jgi:hypothetical protein
VRHVLFVAHSGSIRNSTAGSTSHEWIESEIFAIFLEAIRLSINMKAVPQPQHFPPLLQKFQYLPSRDKVWSMD